MNDFSFKFGKIASQFEIFSYINCKTNNLYTFDIDQISNDFALMQAMENHLETKYKFSDSYSVSYVKVENWENVLSDVFQKWFFDFVSTDENDPFAFEKIIDTKSNFHWSNLKTQKQFTQDFCKQIDDWLEVIEVYEIHLRFNGFYENAWNDFALKGKNGCIFIHLGVSD